MLHGRNLGLKLEDQGMNRPLELIFPVISGQRIGSASGAKLIIIGELATRGNRHFFLTRHTNRIWDRDRFRLSAFTEAD